MCCVQVLRPIRLVVASRILIRFKLADDRPGVHWPRPGPSRCVDLPNVDICDRNDKRNFAGHGECCLDSMSTVGRMGGFRRQNSGSSIRIRVFLSDSKARRDAALAGTRRGLGCEVRLEAGQSLGLIFEAGNNVQQTKHSQHLQHSAPWA